MSAFKKAVALLLLVAPVVGCTVHTVVVERRAPCPGGIWMEGHYGPRGRWHPGHWRCPGVVEVVEVDWSRVGRGLGLRTSAAIAETARNPGPGAPKGPGHRGTTAPFRFRSIRKAGEGACRQVVQILVGWRGGRGDDLSGVAAAMRDMEDDRFQSFDDLCESSHDRGESVDDVEESSHGMEQAAAVMFLFARDGFRLPAVMEQSAHVTVLLKSVVCGSADDRGELESWSGESVDVRGELHAAMGETIARLCEPAARRFRLPSSRSGLDHVRGRLDQVLCRLLHAPGELVDARRELVDARRDLVDARRELVDARCGLVDVVSRLAAVRRRAIHVVGSLVEALGGWVDDVSLVAAVMGGRLPVVCRSGCDRVHLSLRRPQGAG